MIFLDAWAPSGVTTVVTLIQVLIYTIPLVLIGYVIVKLVEKKKRGK